MFLKHLNNTARLSSLILVFLIVQACSHTAINFSHPGIAKDEASAHAIVYILRPWQQRTRGVADNLVDIELAGEQLVSLDEGEYFLIRIKPQKAFILTRSQAMVTAQPNPVKVTRAREFSFEAGQTYYLEAQFTQEEFRGIYFIPKLIEHNQAVEFAKTMKAVGKLAKQSPLYKPPPIKIEIDRDF